MAACRINDARNVYRAVAQRGSMLFFLLNSLNKIHAFYQFSLDSFVAVRWAVWREAPAAGTACVH